MTFQPALPRGFPGYVALLRDNADVRNIWLAQVVSQLGDWFNNVALLGLINQLTPDPLAPALVQTLIVLPNALTSLTIGGYLADRFDRKRLAIGVDILRALVALALLLVRDASGLWIAYAAITTLSLGEALFSPALSAAQPNLCRPHELATANALQQSTWASVSMLGAFLGGLATALLGRDISFVLNALSFLTSAVFLGRVRGAFSTPGQRVPTLSLRANTEGARFLRGKPVIAGMSAAKAIWAFAFATAGLYSVYAYKIYELGDAGTSGLLAARGIGSFLGPLIVQSAFLISSRRQFALTLAAAFVFCIGGYGLWGATPSVWLGVLGIFVGHIGGGTLWTYSRIYVQRETPDALRGRVMALDMVGFTLILGVFSMVWGLVARATTPAIGVLSGVATTAVLALIWAIWMRRYIRAKMSHPE